MFLLFPGRCPSIQLFIHLYTLPLHIVFFILCSSCDHCSVAPPEKNTKNFQIVFISIESKTFTYFLVVRSLSSFEEISPPFIHFAVVVFGLFAFCVSVFFFLVFLFGLDDVAL